MIEHQLPLVAYSHRPRPEEFSCCVLHYLPAGTAAKAGTSAHDALSTRSSGSRWKGKHMGDHLSTIVIVFNN